MDRLRREADEDNCITLEDGGFAGVSKTEGQRSREIYTSTPEGRRRRCPCYRKHAHHVAEGLGVGSLAGQAVPANLLEQVPEVRNQVRGGEDGSHRSRACVGEDFVKGGYQELGEWRLGTE